MPDVDSLFHSLHLLGGTGTGNSPIAAVSAWRNAGAAASLYSDAETAVGANAYHSEKTPELAHQEDLRDRSQIHSRVLRLTLQDFPIIFDLSFPVSLFGDIVRGLISPNIENSPKGHKAFMPLASFRLSGFDEIGADLENFPNASSSKCDRLRRAFLFETLRERHRYKAISRSIPPFLPCY